MSRALEAATWRALQQPGVRSAAAAARRGQVLAYPTEAVWGLGSVVSDIAAAERIIELKRRDADKGMILVAGHISQFDFLLEGLSRAAFTVLQRAWPGHVTFLVPHRDRLSPVFTGAHKTIALRVSAHPVVRALCLLAGEPLVSTSANRQGGTPARYSFQVRRYFGDQVVYCPGQVNRSARPSRIQDLITGKVLRR